MARYAPRGHLVFLRSETLFAVPFDARRRRVTGDAGGAQRAGQQRPVERRRLRGARGGRLLRVRPGQRAPRRSGRSSSRIGPESRGPVPVPPRSYNYPRFSPDGKRLAVSIGPGHGNSDDVWTVDVETGALTRLTFGDGNGNYYPVWSNDGRRIAYSSDRAHQGIYLKNADGSGEEEPLQPEAASGASRGLVARRLAARHHEELSVDRHRSWSRWRSERRRPSSPRPTCPSFSPDGRWVAYTVLTPGNPPQILVRARVGRGGKGADHVGPRRLPGVDRPGLYFMVDKKVYWSTCRPSPCSGPGPVRELFEMPLRPGLASPARLRRDARRGDVRLRDRSRRAATGEQVDVKLDWASELSRLAPAVRKK